MLIPTSHLSAWPALAAPFVFLGIVDVIVGALDWLFGAVADAAVAIAAVLVQVWATLLPVLIDIWHVFRAIWSDVLVPFWGKFKGWIQTLQGWWNDWAKPVTDILNKIAAFERAIWNATLGPLFDTISGFQKLLTLLHLQQTALGKQIDGVLQEVETKLQSLWNTIVGPINAVISLVQGWILDVDGTLRQLLLIPSIGKHFAQIWNVWWTKSLPALSPAGQAVLAALRKTPTISQHRDLMRQALVNKAGALYEAGADGRQLFSQLLEGQEPADPDLTELS